MMGVCRWKKGKRRKNHRGLKRSCRNGRRQREAAGSGGSLVVAVNGERFELSTLDPSTTLLDFLRSHTTFKSVKLGCGEGGCGACVVLLSKYDPVADQVKDFTVSSCLTLLCSVNGRLDTSMLKSPCIVVSSSCSTDETVVADSDVEEMAISVLATSSVGTKGVVETVPHEIIMSYAAIKSEDNYVMSSRRSTDMRGKLDESESGIADIMYSQDLIVRNTSLPCAIISTANNRVVNFKCFRKTNTRFGNSFSRLIPFLKSPYKDSDYGSEEMVESMKEEKRRKQMEAISEELFSNEAGRRRGVAGSLRGILTHG